MRRGSVYFFIFVNRSGDFPPEERVAAANRVIASVAEETGAVLVDLHSAFLTKELSAADSYLTNPNNSEYRDGLHPNRDGYALMAALLLDAIRRKSLPCSRIACLGDSITYGQYMTGAGTADGGHLFARCSCVQCH